MAAQLRRCAPKVIAALVLTLALPLYRLFVRNYHSNQCSAYSCGDIRGEYNKMPKLADMKLFRGPPKDLEMELDAQKADL